MNIAVFISGGGSNLQALIDACEAGRIDGKIKLVISSKEGAGGLERAKKHNVEAQVVSLKNFASADEMDAHLTKLCKDRKVDLICLAGYMVKVGPSLIKAYPNAILNIHPALLPNFGGKGFYGEKVHEAVIKSGAKVSGCTVHLVNGEYDRGPIILQRSVPVFNGDTAHTLAERVLEQEHIAYPQAVKFFCEGRVKISGEKITIMPQNTSKAVRALISVSDKTGILEFAKELASLGIEIVSTSGTAKHLAENNVPVRMLENLTGHPEILGGRVKTLHPAVHGGILFRREDTAQCAEAQKLGIEPLDIIVVNLYPFAETLSKAKAVFSDEVIEQIDIGGVALIRAGCKNCESVTVITDPADYKIVIEELRAGGQTSLKTRRKLAAKGFSRTASYDATISNALAKEALEEKFPPTINLSLNKITDMRYGENPHQQGALYSFNTKPAFVKLQGKELSYNNILDAEGTWQAVND
ncbi:MAG: phosphoribosylglycinamide formyltransferase, partial [Elusimicrobia bacterium]|nr:phosphoribosylglycinamide formyltransferase [Elusimicrobiota bacterium]